MLIRLFSHQTTGSHTLTRTRTPFVQWKTRNLLFFWFVFCTSFHKSLSVFCCFLACPFAPSFFPSFSLPFYSHCYPLSLMFISCFNVSSSYYICIIFFLLLCSFFLYVIPLPLCFKGFNFPFTHMLKAMSSTLFIYPSILSQQNQSVICPLWPPPTLTSLHFHSVFPPHCKHLHCPPSLSITHLSYPLMSPLFSFFSQSSSNVILSLYTL